ncbi:hypothetical protein FHS18_002572 [Paenibacillus phyllosphaerae]|uniref:Multi-tm2 domain protein n=1 Tax=Paenibacillus phyllosphaerae TaxID=274593 RepID=A0A7W5AXA0_9BACL|nr:hypothetical protein [Paenibacillus phyllosphaerae]MBB3110505.1 hypothetical protein [Paenibacillus phyllosphaerae]
MVRNPIVTLLLGIVPGLGHFSVGRKARGFIYALIIFGITAFGFLVGVAEGMPEFFFVMLLIAFGFWLINMLDLVIYLLRHNGQPAAGMGGYPGHLPVYGPHMDASAAGWGAGDVPPPPGSAGMGHGGEFHGGGSYGAGPYGSGMPPYGVKKDDAGERFYTILLSFVPGLGHLSLGLMQRGLTLLIGFFGLLTMILFITALANEGGFLVFLGVLPIVWLYGMFDAIRQVQRKQAGEPLIDRSIMEDWDEHRVTGKRSRWFATVLSIMPGAGHMYLGLQKRGLQLMAAFLLSIYLLDALSLSLFLFIVPLIWCFAFFDSLQLQSRYALEGYVPDVPVVDWLMYRQKWIGIALLLLGVYYLFDRLLLDYLERISVEWGWQFRYYFKTGMTALVLIGVGIKLLLGGKSKEVQP